jgi:hypothetical protein
VGIVFVLLGLAFGAIGALLYLIDFIRLVLSDRTEVWILAIFRLCGLELRSELGEPPESGWHYGRWVHGREFDRQFFDSNIDSHRSI